MDVVEALNSRFTVRAFKPDPIDTETILLIVGAATRAPSSGNTQPWELFIVGGDTLDRLRQAYAVNFQKGMPATPDIPAPREWPPTLQKRVEESREARLKALGVVGDGIAARHAMSERRISSLELRLSCSFAWIARSPRGPYLTWGCLPRASCLLRSTSAWTRPLHSFSSRILTLSDLKWEFRTTGQS